MDGEVEKEDILEEEAKEEKKKEESKKGCASMPYILYGNFLFNSGPAWPALVPTLCGINFSMV